MTKRASYDVSSDEEEEVEFPPRKIHRRNPQSSSVSGKFNDIFISSKDFFLTLLVDRSARVSSMQNFRSFLANALPTALVNPQVKKYLVWQSNNRLLQAQKEGVNFLEIFIGPHCLPTWPGDHWDPEEETMHEVLQRHLAEYQASKELGSLLRKDLIAKSNCKLNEAKAMGVLLKNVRIGDGLLPTWTYDDGPQELGTVTESLSSEMETASTSITTVTSIEETDLTSCSLSPVSSTFDSESDTESDSGTGCDYDDDDDENPEYVYTISLNNFVDDHVYYSDEQPSHVFHDAEVVGGPCGFEDVDLEVFVIDEDEDVSHLPEVELAIDRDAYEYYYDTTDAVDLEMPGIEVSCTGEIEAEENVIEKEPVRSRHAWKLLKPSRPASGVLQRLTRSTDGVAKQTPVTKETVSHTVEDDEDSDMSEEVTDDEGMSAMEIQDTADGFTW